MRSSNMFVTKTHLVCCVSLFMISMGTMFFTSTTASTITCLETGEGCPLAFYSDVEFQNVKEDTKQGMVVSQEESKVPMLLSRRLLVGPGSHSPFCRTKCMQCTPCTPILVTGISKAEYGEPEPYPQEWKCTCGTKLYDP